jgi:hypothetical protein
VRAAITAIETRSDITERECFFLLARRARDFSSSLSFSLSFLHLAQLPAGVFLREAAGEKFPSVEKSRLKCAEPVERQHLDALQSSLWRSSQLK